MTTCVVISRNGAGEVWRFDSLKTARLHPITQSWDVFATSGDELVRQFGRKEIDQLLRFTEGRDRSALISSIEQVKSGRSSADHDPLIKQMLWDKLIATSKKPPQEAEELIKIIAGDKLAVEGKTLMSRPDGDAPVRQKTQTGEDDMGDKREVFRMDDNGTISFGTDDKGVPYSAENTPKRGDNTKTKFSIYRDGMTVKEALDAGLTRSNIRRDRRAGFIVITNPEAPAEEPKEAKGKKSKAEDSAAENAASAAE